MDFIKDNNPKHIKHVETLMGEFPSYVKQAYKAEIPAMPRGSYADSRNKEFPVDDMENTFLSYAYFKSANLNDGTKVAQEVEGRIKNAATIQGIDNDLIKIDEALGEYVKKTSPAKSTKFALAIDYGEDQGGLRYYYPTSSRELLEKSARELTEDFDKLPLEAFRVAALEIVKKAAQYKIPKGSLPQMVERTGADKDFNYKIANYAVKQREHLFGESAGALYKDIVKSATADTEHVEDYVKLFIDLDRVNGVKYGSEALNPYEAFYSGYDKAQLEKLAKSYVLVSDAPIPLEEFTKIAKTAVANFNEEESELLEKVVKAAEQNGIKASGELKNLSEDLQARFLGALVNEPSR
jgi:hypothetical protein